MEIPEKLIRKWKTLRSPNDTKEMAKLLPESAPETFNRAFREKKCRDEVFNVMAAFYEKKAELIKEYL